MLKKSMLAVCLFGLTWAGTAQAGFLGNNLQLQWLQGISPLVTSPVDVTTDPTNTSIMGIDLAIGDSALDLKGSATLPTDLTIVDINNTLDPIIGASGPGVTYGQNSDGHQYVLISGLDGNIDTSVDVQFAPTGSQQLLSTVPEPGAFDLMALGLAIMGMKAYLRRRVRA